jgi:gliding motility-associated-like protein
MKKSLFFLLSLFSLWAQSFAQNNELNCLPFVSVQLEITDSTCQTSVSPFQVLTGDLQNYDESNFLLTIFDSNPNNGNILDGPGVYEYEIQCFGLDIPPCGDFTSCIGQISAVVPVPNIDSDAAVLCPAANPGPNSPGGTQDCEKVCAGSTVTYTLTDSLFTIESVQVSGSDNFTIFGNRVEVTWENAGFGSLLLLITGPCGSEQQVFTCTEVLENPSADFKTLPEASGDTLFICQGQSVQFLNNSQAAETFFWSFGDGNTSAEGQPSHRYELPGTYTATLSAFNECECVDEARLTIVVEEGEVPIVDCVGTLCAGQTGTYEATTDCSTYTWSVTGNGTIVDGGGPQDDFISVEWNEGPAGTVFLEVSDCPDPSSCTGTFEAQVPILADTIAINGSTNVCRAGTSVYSIAPYAGTAMTWSTSGFGTILEGQGTNEIIVEWVNFLPNQPQWVAVELNNCYLGCIASDTLPVRITPGLILEAPLEACAGDTIDIDALSIPNGSPVSSTWVLQNATGDTVSINNSPTDTWSLPLDFADGLYEVTATPETGSGYCLMQTSAILRVLPVVPAIENIQGARQICPGQVYTYEATSDLSSARFFWTINDGGTLSSRTGNPINVSFGPAPPYEISVRQESVFKCSSPDTLMTLDTIPELQISGPDETCNQEITSYSVAGIDSLDYNWSISPAGAGTIINENGDSDIIVSWHYTGFATITMEACGQIAILQVAVYGLPEPVVDHPDVLCPEETATVQTTTPFDSYLWLNEMGDIISLDGNPELGPGFYRTVVTDFNGCAEDTLFLIRGYEAPAVSISTPDPNGFCNAAPSTRLFATNTGPGYTFQWLQDGNPVGNNSAQYTAVDFGDYQVRVTDQNGCTDLSNTISVLDCPSASGGGVFPNSPGGCAGSIGIQQISNGDCNDRSYEALVSGNYIPGTAAWNFDDPGSGGGNVSFGTLQTSHVFSGPGYYRILFIGEFTDPGTGQPTTCTFYRPDTVYAVAHFNADTVCAGEMTTFTDRSTFIDGAGIDSWAWDFGNPASPDNTSSLSDPQHLYTAPGVYVATLTIISNGCTSTFSRPVTVKDNPAVAFPQPTVNCADEAVQFEANTGPDVTELFWSFGDPGSAEANEAEGTIAYHRFGTPGTYTVSLTAIGRFGCDSTYTETVTILPNNLSGTISASGNQFCAGDTAVLTASPGGTSWIWSNGSAEDSLLVTQTGTYGITVTNANGCTYTPDPVQLAFHPAPEDTIRAVLYNELGQPLGYVYDTLEVCEGTDVFLETLSNPDYSYTWSNGIGAVSIEFSDDRGNLLTPGTYTYNVTVTETASSCINVEGPFTVIVNPAPEVQISQSPGGFVCEGTLVTFSVDNPDPALSYRWSNGVSGPLMETDQPGRYTVTATNSFSCESESNALQIEDGPDISLVPNGCYSRCRPDTLCLPEIPGISTYQWVFEGTPIGTPSTTVPELIATESGSYWLDMVAENGCALSSEPLQLELFDGLSQLEGLVYIDVNNNGIIDAADTTYNGAIIDLLQNNNLLNTATANAATGYTFLNLPGGNYQLQLDTAQLPQELVPVYTEIDTTTFGCFLAFPADWLLQVNCAPDTTSFNFTGCDSVSYQGVTYNQDTVLETPLTSFWGCDSLLQVVIDVLQPTIATLQADACEGDVFDYQGTLIPAGTQQDFTFSNASGCDSIVTVVVETLFPTDSTLTLAACQGESADYQGASIPAGTQQDFTFSNANGCDSIVTVVVETLLTTDSTLTLAACPGQSADYQGTPVPAGTQQDFNFTNANGCDSIVTVIVETLLPTDSTLTLTACQGETADYQGTPVPAGTQQDFTFSNASGCDSLVTVVVETLLTTDSTLTLAACPDQSADYQGTLIPAGTQQDFTFSNANGCDSIVTVVVGTLLTTDSTLTLAACPGQTADYQGTLIPAGTQQDFTFSNANGCDSIVTVMVEALLATDSTLTLAACTGQSADYQGTLIPAGTQQDFNFTNANGCDSVVTVMVETLLTTDSTLTLAACTGQSADYQGTLIPAGTQQDFNFTNANGCDSAVTVMVETLLTTDSTLTLAACPGQTADYQGTLIPAGTQQDFNFTNANGCDSVVTVVVETLLTTDSTLTLAACPGESADYQGTPVPAGTQQDFNFSNANGCDSVVTVLVEALLATDSTLQVQACAGTDYQYQGNSIPAGSTDTFTFTNSNGCDSVVTVEVEAVDALETNLSLSVCEGSSINYNGTDLQAGQDTIFTFQSAAGCDSLVQVEVAGIVPDFTTVNFEACTGETVSFESQTLNPGDSLQLDLMNSQGCDSTVLVVVEELPSPVATVNTEPSCPDTNTGTLSMLSNTPQAFEYSVEGLPVQSNPDFTNLSAGNYGITITDSNSGCTSVLSATLEALPPLEAELMINTGSCEAPATSVGAVVLSGAESDLFYDWSNGETGPVAQFDSAGNYNLILSNACEEVMLDFQVQTPRVDPEAFLYLPSAFSPNEDGNNDTFLAYPALGMTWQSFNLMVFDRWGNQLFESNDPLLGWDGIFKGSLMNTGLYVYHLKGRVFYCGQEMDVEREGGVMLVR